MTSSGKIEILNFLKKGENYSSKEIHEGIRSSISYATVKRIITNLISENLIVKKGKGKSTKYSISLAHKIFQTIDVEDYFQKEIDDRKIIENFNLTLITETLSNVNIFTENELTKLSGLQNEYRKNISELEEIEYEKELERLSIDLSWKSSQIEGNTYSLLETEQLLKEKQTASGKTKEEAVMLLNHKDAIDFIIKTLDYLTPLSIPKIEDIHSLLTKDLEVNRNIRKRRVGISGTNYNPLDNEFQIREALSNMCELVNARENIFEKALLALMLISYIQPFSDGNKRTARIVSNAILMNYGYCPLSFRTVDSIEYKKAMLIFYERNNLTAFKNIFMTQFEFAVNKYF